MKILYFSPSPVLNLSAPTGYGSHMRGMINAFKEAGNEVLPVIIGGTELDEVVKKQPKSHLKRYAKKIIPPLLWESLKDYQLIKRNKSSGAELEKKIIEFKPDLIYERAGYLQSSGVEIALRHKIKHVLEVNSPFTEQKKILDGPSLFLNRSDKVEKEQLSSTGRVVVVSSALKEYFINKHSIDPQKFIIVPNAVNLADIREHPEMMQQLRSKYGLENATVIGFVGSIFPWHGVDMLIEVFKEIEQLYPNIKLLIVGNSIIMEELKRLAGECILSGKVIFTNKVPAEQVYNYIGLMDITVMPKSNWYGSPVKIFEYGAMGRAVIAPDNGPVNDVMISGEDGFLIKPDNESLQEAVVKLLNSSELRTELGANFKKKVLKKHTWQAMAERILSSMN